MLKHETACLGLAAMLSVLGSGTALGAPDLSPEALMRMAPAAQRAYVEAQVARQQTAQRSGTDAAPLDVTAPVLTLFNASPTLNLQLAQPSFRVAVNVTDDLSGFYFLYYQVTGPSGQSGSGAVQAFYPLKNFAGKASAPYFNGTRMLEPGVWTIVWASAVDFAGNYSSYNQAQLAALGGNTSFTVINNKGYDLVPPVVTSGQILTPVVSLSTFAKGTSNKAPYIGVKLTATDAGTSALAGLDFAQANLCLADRSRCISAYVYTNADGVASGTLYLGGQVSPASGHVPGEYLLYQLLLWDQSGNSTYLTSSAFGGATDFSTLFPTTTITLTP